MKNGLLATHGSPLKAVVDLLGGMIREGVVDEALVPATAPSGGGALSLVSDPQFLSHANPWLPVMPVQGARMVSNLAFTDPGRKVAVVLRPCEARAAVELIKLRQILPEPLLFITVDCPGTFEVDAFHDSGVDAAMVTPALLEGMASGVPKAPVGLSFRTACTICERPAAEWGDLHIHVFGAQASEAVGLQATAEVAAALEGAGLAKFDGEAMSGRDEVVADVTAGRAKARDEAFDTFRKETAGINGLKKAFSTCIRCYNCMESCPVCYCKTCIFKTPTFDHPSELYPRLAERKGAQKMPADTTLFHLTRINHMAASCIGFGLCDTACPVGLPVATLFRSVAQGVQEMLEYEPGRSVDDALPLSVFREDELEEESGTTG